MIVSLRSSAVSIFLMMVGVLALSITLGWAQPATRTSATAALRMMDSGTARLSDLSARLAVSTSRNRKAADDLQREIERLKKEAEKLRNEAEKQRNEDFVTKIASFLFGDDPGTRKPSDSLVAQSHLNRAIEEVDAATARIQGMTNAIANCVIRKC